MKEEMLEKLDWDKGEGLIPAIIQDAVTGQVLMLGYMNRQALEKTFDSGLVTFWSRSRETLWTKGETSGNSLFLEDIRMDCDRDTLLVRARPKGPVCHTGTTTCFEAKSRFQGTNFLLKLENLVQSRRRDMPEGSYTTALFRDGLNRISKKLGEEAVEVIVSSQEDPQRTVVETADLLYHLLVFLAEREITLDEVLSELESRHSATPTAG